MALEPIGHLSNVEQPSPISFSSLIRPSCSAALNTRHFHSVWSNPPFLFQTSIISFHLRRNVTFKIPSDRIQLTSRCLSSRVALSAGQCPCDSVSARAGAFGAFVQHWRCRIAEISWTGSCALTEGCNWCSNKLVSIYWRRACVFTVEQWWVKCQKSVTYQLPLKQNNKS